MKLIPVWHGHHNLLISWIKSIRERKADIKENKPIDEQPLRLKVIKRVKGKLPLGVVKAWGAFVKAKEACDKIWNATEWDFRTGDVYLRAKNARNRAKDTYDKMLHKHNKDIEALHTKECPNCPWDGESIFRGSEE